MQGQEKAKSGTAAKARVLEQLLPVIDNFEIAGKSIKTETEGEKKINDSYQSLYRQTVDIFRSLGLEAVPTVGVQLLPSTVNARSAVMVPIDSGHWACRVCDCERQQMSQRALRVQIIAIT
jgi:molecular chaperone GrpE (heat shock protein)